MEILVIQEMGTLYVQSVPRFRAIKLDLWCYSHLCSDPTTNNLPILGEADVDTGLQFRNLSRNLYEIPTIFIPQS